MSNACLHGINSFHFAPRFQDLSKPVDLSKPIVVQKASSRGENLATHSSPGQALAGSH